ncbi:hypothetical protein [Nocardia sp. NPDC004711]
MVLKFVRGRLAKPDLADLLVHQDDERIASIADQLQTKRDQIVRARADYKSELIDGNFYNEIRSEAEDEIARLEAERIVVVGTQAMLVAVDPLSISPPQHSVVPAPDRLRTLGRTSGATITANQYMPTQPLAPTRTRRTGVATVAVLAVVVGIVTMPHHQTARPTRTSQLDIPLPDTQPQQAESPSAPAHRSVDYPPISARLLPAANRLLNSLEAYSGSGQRYWTSASKTSRTFLRVRLPSQLTSHRFGIVRFFVTSTVIPGRGSPPSNNTVRSVAGALASCSTVTCGNAALSRLFDTISTRSGPSDEGAVRPAIDGVNAHTSPCRGPAASGCE